MARSCLPSIADDVRERALELVGIGADARVLELALEVELRLDAGRRERAQALLEQRDELDVVAP